MYIPIVVAMAAQQNVVAAVSGGPIVLIAATGSLVLCFGAVALLSRIGRRDPGAASVEHGGSDHRRGDGSGRFHTPRLTRRQEGLTPWDTTIWHGIEHVFVEQSLVAAFAVVGALILVSNLAAKRFTNGRVHGSAIAIVLGLVLAYVGGLYTGGKKGLADIPALAGIGLMGGAMLRDFAIVATAFEVDVIEARRAGLLGVLALALGTILPFIVGTLTAVAFGYHDAVSITTIGAGAITYIVGPVTGAAIGADSTVMALSIATGVTKAVMVMVGTPLVARLIGLDNPRSAMAYGGLMGTVSGVAGGLAATDPKLVPYGALTATFHTGIGCLVGPSILFLTVRALVG